MGVLLCELVTVDALVAVTPPPAVAHAPVVLGRGYRFKMGWVDTAAVYALIFARAGSIPVVA
jgi:hypothetical protein